MLKKQGKRSYERWRDQMSCSESDTKWNRTKPNKNVTESGQKLVPGHKKQDSEICLECPSMSPINALPAERYSGAVKGV